MTSNFSKARSWIFAIEEGVSNVTSNKDEQFFKSFLFNCFSRRKNDDFFFKDVHSPKVLSLIASSEERVSKVISDDDEHSLKARFSILLTEEGIIIRVNDEH